MSSQHVCLHRSVRVMTVLAFGFLLTSPPASVAASGALAPAKLLLNTTARHAAVEPEPGAVAAVRFRVETAQAGLLALDLTLRGGIQPERGSTEVDPFIDQDVDPWDDDLDGRKPPPPPPPAATFGDELYGLDEQDDHTVRTVVTIEAVSDAALQLVLRDRDGLAVAVTRSEGVGTPLRLTRALAVGHYFLEVESLNGDDAVYALTLHQSSCP